MAKSNRKLGFSFVTVMVFTPSLHVEQMLIANEGVTLFRVIYVNPTSRKGRTNEMQKPNASFYSPKMTTREPCTNVVHGIRHVMTRQVELSYFLFLSPVLPHFPLVVCSWCRSICASFVCCSSIAKAEATAFVRRHEYSAEIAFAKVRPSPQSLAVRCPSCHLLCLPSIWVHRRRNKRWIVIIFMRATHKSNNNLPKNNRNESTERASNLENHLSRILRRQTDDDKT